MFGDGSKVNVSVGAHMQLNLGHIATRVGSTLSQHHGFKFGVLLHPQVLGEEVTCLGASQHHIVNGESPLLIRVR